MQRGLSLKHPIDLAFMPETESRWNGFDRIQLGLGILGLPTVSKYACTKPSRLSISLSDRLQSYNPDADADLVRRAYEFSAKAHEGQCADPANPTCNIPWPSPVC